MIRRRSKYEISSRLSDEALRRRAVELGSKIRAEAGIAKAVEIIEHYLVG